MLPYVENIISSELGDIMNLTDWHWTHSHQQVLLHAPQWSVFYSLISRRNTPCRVEESRSMFFDHDYAESAQHTRREYNAVERVLKKEKIRFQTPLTRMRVHFDSGSVIYDSPEEAAEGLRRRRLTVGRDGYPAFT